MPGALTWWFHRDGCLREPTPPSQEVLVRHKVTRVNAAFSTPMEKSRMKFRVAGQDEWGREGKREREKKKAAYKVSRDAASNSLHLSRRKKRGCSGSNNLSFCCCRCHCCRCCPGRGSALLLPSFLSFHLSAMYIHLLRIPSIVRDSSSRERPRD